MAGTRSTQNWPSQPATDAVAVTPDDNNDLANVAVALYVGTTGDVKINTFYGNTVTFKTVPVGIMPVRVSRVWSTGTTASNIVALYN